MSYRSYDERQPLATSRPRDALSHAADELQSLTQATRRLELYASRIGTAEDGQTLRSDIRACRTDIAKHIKNVASDLAQPVPPSDNARKDGLLQQLQQVVAQSKRATEQSLQRERASPMPQSFSDQGYNYQGSGATAANPPQYGNSRMQAQDLEFESKLVEKTSQELDNEMIREQNRAMQSYKQELQSVAGLMADTARYIQEDTEQFRVAEQVSHRVSQNTKESDRIITSASQRQGSSRFKTCCMIAIIIIAVVIIALVIAGVLGMFGAF